MKEGKISMDMLSLTFYLCVAGLALVYYLLPLNKRWWVLLAGSIGFYWIGNCETSSQS